MRPAVLIGVVAVLALTLWYAAYQTLAFTVSFAREMDRATMLARFRPRAQATLVFDRRGEPAFSFFAEQRTDVALDRISRHMIEAIVAVEDKRFFSHHGLDAVRIAGAAWKNIRAGRIREGGSTITQQLARAAQLSPVRTFERKMREALIALRLEERYGKRRILEEYLNTVYFGEGFYGVESAARGYFRKSAADLSLPEAALLAALVRSPSTDAPCVSPQRATARRNLVLRLMHEEQRIPVADLEAALAWPIPDRSHEDEDAAAGTSAARAAGRYFEEEIRRQLVAQFGEDRVLRGGLRVYSTYDPALQASAEQAIATRIDEIRKRRARASELQGSLVALDPRSGDVLALVGGRDFARSSFNRATQARRQAGSAFKPIIYAAALERGYAPGSLLRDLDRPIQAIEGPWLPAGEHEEQEFTLRRALKLSSNRAAAQLLQQIGVSTAIYYAHRLGIESELPPVPSLALGTGEVTLLELTSAYAAFANRGRLASPRLITRVEDAQGVTIFRASRTRVQALRPSTAFLMSSMLADVIASGTATSARAAGFRLPAAGKTGTTDDYADAWFIGYTPHLVAGVWFGLDMPAPIMSGGFGAVVAVPAWARFMSAATNGDRPDWYTTPPGIERVAICRRTGARATATCRHPDPSWREAPARVPVSASLIGNAATPTATFGSPSPQPRQYSSNAPLVYEDLFPSGSVPREVCPGHGAAAVPIRVP